jgi:hypothetical protein
MDGDGGRSHSAKENTDAVMTKALQTVFFASDIQYIVGPQKAKFF